MINISKIFSTLFYIGLIKWIPGTFGTIGSIFIIMILHHFSNLTIFISIFIFLIIISFFSIGIYSKYIEKNDAKEIVIDEFLGVYLIFIFFDYFNSFNYIINIFLIFIIFRIFDIIKPFPANWVDKNIKNPVGVILDDIIAGIYTTILILLINEII